MTSKYLNNYRNRIDYLTSMSRYWITQGDWETANKYIDQVVTVNNEYNSALKSHNNSKATLILIDFN